MKFHADIETQSGRFLLCLLHGSLSFGFRALVEGMNIFFVVFFFSGGVEYIRAI